MVKRDSLDSYDVRPASMVNYLRYYGMHFTKKMCDFAISKMFKRDSSGKKEFIKPITKESLDKLLEHYHITLNNN
jgi:hypothetical protein